MRRTREEKGTEGMALMLKEKQNNPFLLPHPLHLNGRHADNYVRAVRRGERVHARLRRRTRMLLHKLKKEGM